MAAVGILSHTGRPAARRLEADTASWLEARGHRAERLTSRPAVSLDGVGPLDLVVSLGGDGTMLRAVQLAAPSGVPVLGVNLGHLGYLTAVEPEGLREGLLRYLAGEHQVETRMTLTAAVGGRSHFALNDVVLQRPGGGHTVRVTVAVNGRAFVSFAADAVIVATPTGSTAYNLSARGPIVSPRARVTILTPVAPHSLFDRSIVLDGTERIALVPDDGRPAELVVDGCPAGTVQPGEEVEVRPGDHDARLVDFGGRAFQDVLTRKFHLAEP